MLYVTFLLSCPGWSPKYSFRRKSCWGRLSGLCCLSPLTPRESCGFSRRPLSGKVVPHLPRPSSPSLPLPHPPLSLPPPVPRFFDRVSRCPGYPQNPCSFFLCFLSIGISGRAHCFLCVFCGERVWGSIRHLFRVCLDHPTLRSSCGFVL